MINKLNSYFQSQKDNIIYYTKITLIVAAFALLLYIRNVVLVIFLKKGIDNVQKKVYYY